MLRSMHPAPVVLAIARHQTKQKQNENCSSDTSSAQIDQIIQNVQSRICHELGFHKVDVATGEIIHADIPLLQVSLHSPESSHSEYLATPDSTTSSSTCPIRSHERGRTHEKIDANRRRSTVLPARSSSTFTNSENTKNIDYGDVKVDHDFAARLRNINYCEVSGSIDTFLASLDQSLNPEGKSHQDSDCTSKECVQSNSTVNKNGTIFTSPNYEQKKRLLVIIPYREAGIWSRSICMQNESPDDETGSMLAYLRKAQVENYGVLIMNPVAHVSDPQKHVEQVWNQFVTPLSCDVFVIAYSRGTQYVKHLLIHDDGNGIVQDRVKALAFVEPSHYVNDDDPYFARRILARRAIAWLLSTEIDVGSKIPTADSRHGCVCVSAGQVPPFVKSSSGAWALEMVMSSIFGSFAARCGEAAGITVNDARITSCGLCHRKLGLLNRRTQCTWCEVKFCSRCCEDKYVESFALFRVCSLCLRLPCLIDPRKKRIGTNHKSDAQTIDSEHRNSVFIRPVRGKGDDFSLADFDIIKLIGRGACGRVKLVRKNCGDDEGTLYAMKAIKKKLVIQRGLVESTNIERQILDRIDHPYIATLRYAFQNDGKLYLLSQYYPGGSLLDQMRLARRFPEDRTKLYSAEVALALHHLHCNKIIYRDLKLENILVGSDGHVALTDFGMSKQNSSQNDRTSTFVGTYQMMAPEVYTGKPYSQAVDWWALGVLVYEMIDGGTPFNAKSNKLIRNRIVSVDLKFSSRFSCVAIDFVSRLLTKDEVTRLGSGPGGFEELKGHPWFEGLDWDLVMKKEVTFQGQELLKQRHAKEFKNADIYNTFMNTNKVPVDTPVSTRSTRNDNLFSNFSFNFMDPSESKSREHTSIMSDSDSDSDSAPGDDYSQIIGGRNVDENTTSISFG
uniref:Ribosomal protein S6 kinase putative n=1 Tax=Albugo laibachii Nc14 TaxID=890382 RepID=F0WSH3_9STRA|nr:ribosomal protein S6 kinase putative [Albugo laibachii Nc14]|eukprot:CCA24295.1 ribosomal protein S6 kinase putative [Albugo laibachii Nc14]